MWWKIYFWALLVLSLLGLPMLLQYFPFGLYDYISIALNVVLILVMYAYLFRPKILKKKQWKLVFYVLVFVFLEELAELYLLPKHFVTNLLGSTIPLTELEVWVSLLLGLPTVYAVYKLSK